MPRTVPDDLAEPVPRVLEGALESLDPAAAAGAATDPGVPLSRGVVVPAVHDR